MVISSLVEQKKIFSTSVTRKIYNLAERLQDHLYTPLNKNCLFGQTLTLSSTRAGAQEIRERIRKHNDVTEKQLMQNVQTLDSYLMNITREDREIYHTSDFIKDFYRVEIKNKLSDDTKQKFHAAMNVIRMARITVGDGIDNVVKYYDSLYNKNFTAAFYFLISLVKIYDNYKKNNFKVDWEDVKYKSLSSKTIFPPTVVLMIDEAQNYNQLEWLVIDKLISVSQHVYIAGNNSFRARLSSGRHIK